MPRDVGPRHAIHLGAAWEAPVIDAHGRVVWRRSFGRPTGVGPGEKVVLAVAGGRVAAAVAVNGVSLPPLPGDAGRWEHCVASLLGDRNELEFVVAAAAAPGSGGGFGRGPLPDHMGRVTIEIVGDPSAAWPAPDADGNA